MFVSKDRDLYMNENRLYKIYYASKPMPDYKAIFSEDVESEVQPGRIAILP